MNKLTPTQMTLLLAFAAILLSFLVMCSIGGEW